MTKKEKSELKLYCLYKHFAALYRQSSNNELADFAEPCTGCKICETCQFDWMSFLLEDMPEDIHLNLGH